LGGAEEKWIDLPEHQHLLAITEMIEDFDFEPESNSKLYVTVLKIGDREQVTNARIIE